MLSKVIFATSIAFVLLAIVPAAQAQGPGDEYRTWTDSTGKFKIEAAFVKIEGGDVFLKRKDNGETVTVPLRRMSQADLAIARRMTREQQNTNKSASPESTQFDGGESDSTKKAWTGSWNNRKYGTNGPVTCIAVVQNEKTWKASFVGKGIGKPFKYDVTINATNKSDQIQLQGNSKVDGDTYQWNGYVRGNTLYGRYRSASGNNGEFQLKETKVPATTNLQPNRSRSR